MLTGKLKLKNIHLITLNFVLQSLYSNLTPLCMWVRTIFMIFNLKG